MKTSREQLSSLMRMVKRAYQRFDGETELWHQMLGDFSPAEIKASIEDHIRESRFPPTIADVKSRIRTTKNPGHHVTLSESDRFQHYHTMSKRGIYPVFHDHPAGQAQSWTDKVEESTWAMNHGYQSKAPNRAVKTPS